MVRAERPVSRDVLRANRGALWTPTRGACLRACPLCHPERDKSPTGRHLAPCPIPGRVSISPLSPTRLKPPMQQTGVKTVKWVGIRKIAPRSSGSTTRPRRPRSSTPASSRTRRSANDHPVQRGRAGDPRQAGRLGDDRGLRARRAAPSPRSTAARCSSSTRPSRSRSSARRRRRSTTTGTKLSAGGDPGPAVRLAQGQVRRVLAGGAAGHGADACGDPRPGGRSGRWQQ